MDISLTELLFNTGKDQDWPSKNSDGVLVFDKNDQYRVEGKTHDGISHAIKHMVDIFPSEVDGILSQFSSFLNTMKEEFWLQSKGGEITHTFNNADGKGVSVDRGTLLNTLDRINDKVKNGETLVGPEGSISNFSKEMFDVYDKFIHDLDYKAIDVNKMTNPEQIEKVIASGKPFSLLADYKGHSHKYIFDPQTKTLVSFRDDGSLNTAFKLDTNLLNYVQGHGRLKNKLVQIALMKAGKA
jgi:hypothetical protein